MSEWLTTGQLIEKLEWGVIAELEEKAQIPFKNSYRHVTKNRLGDIKWCKPDGEIDYDGKPLMLFGHVLTWKWRILPNYVSFEEAMKALKDGKRVTVLLYDGFKMTITSHDDMHDNEIAYYSFNELFNAKWTIEE